MSSVATIEVMSHTPAALAGLFRGELQGAGDPDAQVGAIVSDSRRVSPGGVFIALRGAADDGHRHLADATARGAALAVVDRPVDAAGVPPLRLLVANTGAALRQACASRLNQLGCTVVGITGSVGKTTVKEMCAHVLAAERRVAWTPGNLNTWTGVPLSVLELEGDPEVFVAELAMSAPGEIRDLAGFTHPRVAVILNVGLAHVGLLGSREAIAAAKAELLEALPSGGVAVLNADDPEVAAMPGRVANRAPGWRTVWFGLGEAGTVDYRASDIRLHGLAGSEFTLEGPGGRVRVQLPVAGRHAVLNACAVAAVAAEFGVGLETVAARLAGFSIPGSRGRILTTGGGVRIYDDSYNSSPTSLSAALEVLGAGGGHRRVAVLGDMLELGHAAETLHREAGRSAAAAATDLIAVGEYGPVMAEAAVAAGMERGRAVAAADAKAALAALQDLLARSSGEDPEDGADRAVTILVKGSRAIELDRVVKGLEP